MNEWIISVILEWYFVCLEKEYGLRMQVYI